MRERVVMVVFIVVLGSFLTGALVGVNQFTAPRIEKNEARKLQRNVLLALGIPFDEPGIERIFGGTIETVEKGGAKIYRSKSGDVAFSITGSGSWGPISGILAIAPDLETIKGITVIHNEETPGLGDRVFEKKALDAYKGKKLTPEFAIVRPGTTLAENQVDGITGATLTGNAFQKIINSEYKKYSTLIREGL